MSDNRKTISFKCSEDEAQRYKDYASEHNMTQSDLLRAALNSYMRQNNREGNGAMKSSYCARVNFMMNKRPY